MLLLILIIFVKMFSLTKQEQYWKVVDSINFTIYKSVQIENFIKYKNENNYLNYICYNTSENNQVPVIKKSCGSRADVTKSNFMSSKNCSLEGSVTTVKILSNNYEFDQLVFLWIEGCSLVDVDANEFERIAVLMTNSIETDYETLLLTYKWINTQFLDFYSCTDLCENIILMKCNERNNLIFLYVINGVLVILIILAVHKIHRVYMKKKYLSK